MTTEKIQIQILLFGACRESANVSDTTCELAVTANVASAWESLIAQHPALQTFERSVLFAVNEEHAPRTQALQAGDVLAIFPPVSGG